MRSPLPSYNSLTASAKVIEPKRSLAPQNESWQEQVWDYFDRLGELHAAVIWKANSMSRVRLLAAELGPNGEEPIPVETGPAADAVARLAGGTGGQAQLMREMVIHLSVPGEGWLVGETLGGGDPSMPTDSWTVASADELRVASRGASKFQIRETEKNWRDLNDGMVIRFWDPHPRRGWEADSDARHAMGAMLELDLINKRIVAEIISRLTSNGILLYDKGKLSFPVQPDDLPAGADATDRFARILVEVASRGIADATSPEATIPIPIGYDLGDLEAGVDPGKLLQHIRLAEFLDEKLLLERESAVKRLATSLDMPAETLLGMGDTSHWGAWQIEESGIKIHIAPKAELLVHSLTAGYLIPTLETAGESLVGPNGGRLVVWYDPSELTTRPDKSSNTVLAYDRGEASGRALRREIGLPESDAMTPAEFQQWMTKFAARQPTLVGAVLESVGGPVLTSTVEDSGQAAEEDLPQPEQQSIPDEVGDRPDEDLTNPQQAAQILTRMNDLELGTLAAAISSEFDRREPIGTGWVDASEPLATRVTPTRRDRSKAEV